MDPLFKGEFWITQENYSNKNMWWNENIIDKNSTANASDYENKAIKEIIIDINVNL